MMRVLAASILILSVSMAAELPMTVAEKEGAVAELAGKLKPVMGGDWETLLTRFKPHFDKAATKSEFYDVVHDLFAATKKSHFYVLPPETAKLERAAESDFGRTGMVCTLVDDAVTVVSVAKGSPADEAGIAPGFVIEALDRVSLKSVVEAVKKSTKSMYRQRVAVSRRINYWLRGVAGAKRRIVGKGVGGAVTTHVLTLKKAEGFYFKQGHLGEEWLEFEAKKMAKKTVGYVRFNVFAMPLLSKIRNAITSFESCKAIIIDLRGNPGGLGMMAIPIAGMFMDKRGDLGETKSGDDVFRYPVFPVKNPFAGRLVIITNELSASTSEILAAGLQEAGCATIVGTQTMGAVLPSLIIKLENGGIIQYPIGDFKTPKGTLLEGRGVMPDVIVTFDAKTLKKSNDPILTRALETIAKGEPLEK